MHPVCKRFLHLHHMMPCFSPCGLHCMASGIVRPVEAGAAIRTLTISMEPNLSPWAGWWYFARESSGASQCTTHCCLWNNRCHSPYVTTLPVCVLTDILGTCWLQTLGENLGRETKYAPSCATAFLGQVIPEATRATSCNLTTANLQRGA